MARHPLAIPGLLALCFLAGTGWSFYSGAPGYPGAVLILIPLAFFARAIYRSRKAAQQQEG